MLELEHTVNCHVVEWTLVVWFQRIQCFKMGSKITRCLLASKYRVSIELGIFIKFLHSIYIVLTTDGQPDCGVRLRTDGPCPP